jgi:hypothetical protein
MSVINFATAIAPVVEAPAEPFRSPRLNQTPTVRVTMRDQKAAVRVELSGIHGAGRWMLVDHDTWTEMSAAYGAAWCLGSNGNGKLYVRAGRTAIRDAVQHPSGNGTTQLARLIMGAERGEAVLYRNGDPTDLRRANLLKLSQAEAAVWRREQVARIEERAA